ncbi:Gfo/Idh/MocA family protein [Nocardioides sp. CFH 31398]|uniref:Gfo/Idh/MocA family protein n=1 Tax=Nocardioides sp. CFH 31398 TaxID=2919579 RepID=UPI001F05914D|nr:Gfo/Idh/MocA family oxidoreductase [Nocardioides sp. CFH 31398]MCH1867262.1 Gfo/Idh/MocA family oxidoreductase [Nocardioides sp. CFH 31398]
MTRVVLVGAGGVGQRHAAVLAGLDGVSVEAVVDADADAARRLAETCGARAVAEVAVALDEVRPDAVYVCVPPFAHGEPERAALSRGIPFFVEKPLDVDLEVAELVAREVDRRGLVTATGYHWRQLDTVATARDHLARRPALLATGTWLDKRPPVGWWAHRSRSGGQVVEQVTHLVDVARVLLGEVEEVHALGARRPAPGGTDTGDVDDATVAVLRFTSGAVASLAATSLLEVKHETTLRLVGEGLVAELSETALSVQEGLGAPQVTSPRVDPRVEVDRDFVAAVRGERDATRAPYADALRTHRVCVALAGSAASGRPVRVSGAGR